MGLWPIGPAGKVIQFKGEKKKTANTQMRSQWDWYIYLDLPPNYTQM